MTNQATTTEPTLEELAIEAARFLESMPDIIIGKTQREAQQIAFALRSRVSVPSIAPNDRVLAAFRDAAIKCHFGYKHKGKWEECEWIECEDRRKMIESPTVPGIAPVGGEQCVKCGHFSTIDIHNEGECQVRGQSGFICGCKCEFPITETPTCIKCGHSDGIERTLKRCKARTDGGEALCQCHCVFPAAPASTVAPQEQSERDKATPLCAVHQRLEDAGKLECEVGNDCVACSLNERRELLALIAPFAAEGNTEDSITVQRRVAEFYQTHAGEGRVIVSYPAPASPAALSDEPELPPSVKTGIDSIVRHIARPIRGCATDDQYTDVVQRATDALIAAAKTLTRKNEAPSTASTAAAKITDQLIPHLDHAFLLTKGWRDQIASIIERSLSSGS